ncbi:unnamed protein product [Amoebophrya sp. A25]|nr:unnamed protein product [Amoebophrya sp. A25]|eukprot:GSA25T00004976001.1
MRIRMTLKLYDRDREMTPFARRNAKTHWIAQLYKRGDCFEIDPALNSLRRWYDFSICKFTSYELRIIYEDAVMPGAIQQARCRFCDKSVLGWHMRPFTANGLFCRDHTLGPLVCAAPPADAAAPSRIDELLAHEVSCPMRAAFEQTDESSLQAPTCFREGDALAEVLRMHSSTTKEDGDLHHLATLFDTDELAALATKPVVPASFSDEIQAANARVYEALTSCSFLRCRTCRDGSISLVECFCQECTAWAEGASARSDGSSSFDLSISGASDDAAHGAAPVAGSSGRVGRAFESVSVAYRHSRRVLQRHTIERVDAPLKKPTKSSAEIASRRRKRHKVDLGDSVRAPKATIPDVYGAAGDGGLAGLPSVLPVHISWSQARRCLCVSVPVVVDGAKRRISKDVRPSDYGDNALSAFRAAVALKQEILEDPASFVRFKIRRKKSRLIGAPCVEEGPAKVDEEDDLLAD